MHALKQLLLRMANIETMVLSRRVAAMRKIADGEVLVLDWGLDAPSTKGALAALAANGVEGRVLAVLRPEDEAIWKSLRNLGDVHVCGINELNAYDVLVSDWVIFTPDTLPKDKPVTRGRATDSVAEEAS